MGREIERKFLVCGDFMSSATDSVRLTQGYLSRGAGCSVRVRAGDGRGWLTVKGPGDAAGVSRQEWEWEIAETEARELLGLCTTGVIDKTRWLVPAGRHTFEVDVFHGPNEGLVVAEVELDSADEVFERPSWLGREVSGETKYYNSMLAKHPYSEWSK